MKFALPTGASSLLRRSGFMLGVVAMVYFAVQQGEYSTTALFKQKSRLEGLRAQVDSLTLEVDSLRAYKRLVETDAATQERVARERHGMVRGDKEILFRFIESDKRP
jgi:cell division protein FtsB